MYDGDFLACWLDAEPGAAVSDRTEGAPVPSPGNALVHSSGGDCVSNDERGVDTRQ